MRDVNAAPQNKGYGYFDEYTDFGGADGVLDFVGGDTAAEVGCAGVVAGAWERVCGEVGVVRLLPELVAVVGGRGDCLGGDG